MNTILTTVVFFACLTSSGEFYGNQYGISVVEAKYSNFLYVNKILNLPPKNEYLFVALKINNNTFSSHINTSMLITNPYDKDYHPIDCFIDQQSSNGRIDIPPLQSKTIILVFDVPPLEKQILQIKTPGSRQAFILTPHYLF